MSLLHRAFSGFFPFTIAKESAIPSTAPIRNITGFGLSSLCKAFWLAKSVSITASINTTAAFNQSGGPRIVTNSSINQPTIAIPLASFATQARTANNPSLPFPAASDATQIIPWPYTWTSTASPTSGSGNSNLPLLTLIRWFAYLSLYDSYVSKDSSGNYLSAAGIVLPAPGALAPIGIDLNFFSQPPTVPNPYPAAPGIVCNIKIDGVTMPSPIPLFYFIDGVSVSSFSATGNILFDFNEFWTP